MRDFWTVSHGFAIKVLGELSWLRFYFFSVLKYETVSNGSARSLIIKNISKSDCAKYHCLADGAKSKTSTSFVIGGASSGFSKVPKIQGIFQRILGNPIIPRKTAQLAIVGPF